MWLALIKKFHMERIENMKKMGYLIMPLFLALLVSFSCSNPKPIPEEEGVMNALTEVRDGVEARMSYEKFNKLLADARSKIDILKAVEKKNNCFMNAIDKSYASYEISQKAWQQKNAATDQKRKDDMDLTLSFSLGFASVSLAKANECFQK
jgi:hypothetical protein